MGLVLVDIIALQRGICQAFVDPGTRHCRRLFGQHFCHIVQTALRQEAVAFLRQFHAGIAALIVVHIDQAILIPVPIHPFLRNLILQEGQAFSDQIAKAAERRILFAKHVIKNGILVVFTQIVSNPLSHTFQTTVDDILHECLIVLIILIGRIDQLSNILIVNPIHVLT